MNLLKKIWEIIKMKPIYILWHIFLGLLASWITYLVLSLAGAGAWAVWAGLISGSCVGFGVEGYQIVHIFIPKDQADPNWNTEHWLLMSIMDIIEYILGASTVLIMLIWI